MRTLQKISESAPNVLTDRQMYVCFGGKDNTSGTSTITDKETGETCTYTTTDNYDKDGKYIGKCVSYSCDD